MKTIIVIPAYNEASKINGVVAAVKASGLWDVLVVDDGSGDGTAVQAKAAGATVLRHQINRGQGAALKTGIKFASRSGYETAVFFDADGQMAPAEIPLLLKKLNEGYDVVLGSRNLGRTVNMPIIRKIVKKIALQFTRFSTGLKITDTHIGFQAWTLDALKKINLDQDRMAHASQILSEIAKNRLKYAEVPVTIRYDAYSVKKGQNSSGAFKILWDLLIK